MQKKTRVMAPEILLEEYRKLLSDENIAALPLVISGNSMAPFLVHGRDTVYLAKLTRKVKKGDVLLYRRNSGAYILHRVYKIDKDSYTMVGDAQTWLESGIKDAQIIAVMTSALRKGKMQTAGSFWWEFFEKLWIRIVPLRPTLMKLYTCIKGGK